MANWSRLGKTWLPIDSLAIGQPVVMTNEEQTVQWFEPKSTAKHKTAKATDAEGGEHVPAFWTMAVVD